MATANNAKSSNRLTNMSNTIPVPLLITIAPKSGLHPCQIKCLTSGFRRAMVPHTPMETTTIMTIRMIKRIGGEENNGRSRVELMPRSVRVTRSPRQDAIGGAMLSIQEDAIHEYKEERRLR